MRVMLSTIGSRGDVQPLVALASHLKALGQDVRVCVPPDFREWIESLEITTTSTTGHNESTCSVSAQRTRPVRRRPIHSRARLSAPYDLMSRRVLDPSRPSCAAMERTLLPRGYWHESSWNFERARCFVKPH